MYIFLAVREILMQRLYLGTAMVILRPYEAHTNNFIIIILKVLKLSIITYLLGYLRYCFSSRPIENRPLEILSFKSSTDSDRLLFDQVCNMSGGF